MRKILIIYISICSISLIAFSFNDDVNVPSKIKFAGMSLYITKEAKELITKKINTLITDENSFTKLLNRVNLFMPIIEKILEEEGIPNDFKYVPIQESGMISDADRVSASLGFWQFEMPASQDVKLRTDHLIDERMHIIESTKGAARYLKMNNSFLKNWLSTLLAYNRGRGWVERNGYKKYCDDTRMTIDGNTHWYVIHFLAHKLVFEKKLKKSKHPEFYLHQHTNAHGESISSIAKKYKIDEQHLREYNKWMKNTHIVPKEKNYTVIVPIPHGKRIEKDYDDSLPTLSAKLDHANYINTADTFPNVNPPENGDPRHTKKQVNGLSGIIARKGDTISSLSTIGSISEKDFLEYNEIDKNHPIIPGQAYYFESKRRNAPIHLHITKDRETWHSVSQKYAIRKTSLLTKNRVKNEDAELEKGRVIWMRFIRPAKIPIAYISEKIEETEANKSLK